MTDLLDAIDALTKPRIEHMAQTSDEGKYLHTHTAEHKPLLTQLKDAVNPSSNTNAGSASLASARNPINSEALWEYTKIASAIGDWCRIAGADRTRDPIIDLRRWYIAYTKHDADPDWYVAELRRWAKLISKLLDPPKRIELTVACPVCGKRTWVDAEGNDVLFPLVVEYRVPETGESIRPVALCRACETIWHGIEAIEELGIELTETG